MICAGGPGLVFAECTHSTQSSNNTPGTSVFLGGWEAAHGFCGFVCTIHLHIHYPTYILYANAYDNIFDRFECMMQADTHTAHTPSAEQNFLNGTEIHRKFPHCIFYGWNMHNYDKQMANILHSHYWGREPAASENFSVSAGALGVRCAYIYLCPTF